MLVLWAGAKRPLAAIIVRSGDRDSGGSSAASMRSAAAATSRARAWRRCAAACGRRHDRVGSTLQPAVPINDVIWPYIARAQTDRAGDRGQRTEEGAATHQKLHTDRPGTRTRERPVDFPGAPTPSSHGDHPGDRFIWTSTASKHQLMTAVHAPGCSITQSSKPPQQAQGLACAPGEGTPRCRPFHRQRGASEVRPWPHPE